MKITKKTLAILVGSVCSLSLLKRTHHKPHNGSRFFLPVLKRVTFVGSILLAITAGLRWFRLLSKRKKTAIISCGLLLVFTLIFGFGPIFHVITFVVKKLWCFLFSD